MKRKLSVIALCFVAVLSLASCQKGKYLMVSSYIEDSESGEKYSYIYEYDFDEDGAPVSRNKYDEDDYLWETVFFDENMNIVKSKNFYDYIGTYVFDYTYDENGKRTGMSVTVNGQLSNMLLYDDYGLELAVYQNNGLGKVSRGELSVDNEKKSTRGTLILGNATTEFEVSYYSNGQIKEITSKEVEGSVATDFYREYDKNGNLLKSVTEKSTGYYSSTEYKYDRKGNLIEQVSDYKSGASDEMTNTKTVYSWKNVSAK